MKAYKTPLRYPGGKSRAVQKLFAYIREDKTYTEFREPFLGGGSFAIEWTKRYPDTSVWVSDLYEPLVNFWQHVQTDGSLIRPSDLRYSSLNPQAIRDDLGWYAEVDVQTIAHRLCDDILF